MRDWNLADYDGDDEVNDMKLFNTSDIQTVIECQLIFGFKLPSAIIADRSKIFLIKYDSCNNLLFKRFQLSL